VSYKNVNNRGDNDNYKLYSTYSLRSRG